MAFQEQYEARIAEAKRQGKPIWEKDLKLERYHDTFNLLTLPLVVLANAYHMYACYMAPADSDPYTIFGNSRMSGSIAWDICWYVFACYIITDTIWIAILPRTVANPVSILIHHSICIGGWFLATTWPEWEFYTSSSIAVEISTFFLIAKRYYREGLLGRVIRMMDNITWILGRLVWWPIVTYNGTICYTKLVAAYPDMPLNGYINTGLFSTITGNMIMFQNFQWTYEKYFKAKSIVANTKGKGEKTDDKDKPVVDDYLNRMHDEFNLVCLPLVIVGYLWHTYACMSQPSDLDQITIFSLPRISNDVSWTYLWWCFTIYIYVDTMWVMLYPESVGSPITIIIHHVICSIGWMIIFAWPGWEWYIASGLIVEINTWFLIAKRQPRFKQWKIFFFLDDVTWVISRLIFFPINTYNFIHGWLWLAQQYPEQPLGGYWNSGLFTMTACCVVMSQNLIWSYQKFANRKYSGKEKGL
jgi:hypothetical protein